MLKDSENQCTQKIIHPNDIAKVAKTLKENHKTIVTLNGSFDLLHAGHLHIIFSAANLADILIIALNSDSSIKAYKSPNRPIIPLEYRLKMIAALQCVDYVTWFNETDPRTILNEIKPHFHANGAEYGIDCIEADTIKSNGGIVKIIDLVPGLSTSAIIKKIIQIEEQDQLITC